jgi:hypothetical protein
MPCEQIFADLGVLSPDVGVDAAALLTLRIAKDFLWLPNARLAPLPVHRLMFSSPAIFCYGRHGRRRSTTTTQNPSPSLTITVIYRQNKSLTIRALPI